MSESRFLSFLVYLDKQSFEVCYQNNLTERGGA